MKERPILFSGDMVRAILDGSKMQTRRVMKPQPYQNEYEPESFSWMERTKKNEVSHGFRPDGEGGRIPHTSIIPKGTLQSISVHRDWFKDNCPYGQPGDRLWVRENLLWSQYASKGVNDVRYEADGKECRNDWPDDWMPAGKIHHRVDLHDNLPAGGITEYYGKVPSIFMPRWASRITLEIIGLRVERLQDISEEDAKAEGVNLIPYMLGQDAEPPKPFESVANWRFRLLWKSINGAESWAANPWVWVIEFTRVQS